jgi:hypothetical protein
MYMSWWGVSWELGLWSRDFFALPAAGQSEGRGAVSVGLVWFRLLMFSY